MKSIKYNEFFCLIGGKYGGKQSNDNSGMSGRYH